MPTSTSFRTVILACYIFLVLIGLDAAAQNRRWRINNQPTISANFRTIQAAVDSVAFTPGDTIMVESSPDYYNGATIKKRCVIIGAGFWLAETPNCGTSIYSARIAGNSGTNNALRFEMEDGSTDPNSGAAGSKVLALDFDSLYSALYTEVEHITVERSRFETINYTGTLTSLTIQQCYLNVGNSSLLINQRGSDAFSNIIVRNCIIRKPLEYDGNARFSIFTNNVLAPNDNTTRFNIDADEFTNNILTTASPFTLTAAPANVRNNTAANGQFGNTNGNTTAGASALFISGAPRQQRFQLSATSPARGSGVNGVDRGAFGGPGLYKIGGLSTLPLITSLFGTSVVGQGQPVNITVTATVQH